MSNPYFKILKKDESIQIISDGDMHILDVALGIETYFELLAEQHGVSLSKVKETFDSIIEGIITKKSKTEEAEKENEENLKGESND